MAASRRFSSSAKTLWVVVGVLAAAGLVAMGATALADGSDGEREDVARYIERVNGIQGGLGGEFANINRTYSRFSTARGALSTQAAELRRAERTLELLDQQLRALSVPAPAERLHAELLELVSMQIDFAHELTLLGAYLPRLDDARRELGPAGERVRRELAAAPSPTRQARAFGRYAAELERIAANLERLTAPPVLEPARTAEIARLRDLATLSEQLRTAIDEQRPAEIERLAGRIARASATTGATRAERAAVVAFNDRLRRIQAQRALVERQSKQLDRTVD